MQCWIANIFLYYSLKSNSPTELYFCKIILYPLHHLYSFTSKRTDVDFPMEKTQSWLIVGVFWNRITCSLVVFSHIEDNCQIMWWGQFSQSDSQQVKWHGDVDMYSASLALCEGNLSLMVSAHRGPLMVSFDFSMPSYYQNWCWLLLGPPGINVSDILI